MKYILVLQQMAHTGFTRINYLLSKVCVLQVVVVCVVVACVATVYAYPGYYGHGGHDYISAGVEEDKHVSITERYTPREKSLL
jgi:hypothetical protein